jgi:exopolyphosphatase/guanosine-5'-triphosphate,3'-diphosphate pyrophosphatase
MSEKLAVIDIGTNTLLLLIAEHAGAGRLKSVVDLCRFGRLGKGLDASGQLAEESVGKSLDICREYRRVLDDHGIASPRIIATQAMREAKNAAAFVGPAESILNAKIEVIGGKREAELAFTAVARTLGELAGHPYVVVDVGGGSTELISTDGRAVTAAVSVPIGAVRLTERHLHGDPPNGRELAVLENEITNLLRTELPADLPTGVPIVGTAGTATTMAAIHLALQHYDADAVTGVRLTPELVTAQYHQVATASVVARRAIPGIPAERADVIAAGIAIYKCAIERIAAPVMIACDRGIRWGLAFETARG